MEKTISVTFDGEVFHPDEPVDLASNAKATVIFEEKQDRKKLSLIEMPKRGKGKPYAFLDFARSANLDGPSDFSRNLDDYLNGVKSLDD